MSDPLERVLRPIIEGQLRSFANDHPSLLKGVDWYSPRTDKLETFVNSGAKRILHDLLCAQTRMRLISALVEAQTAEVDHNGVVAASDA